MTPEELARFHTKISVEDRGYETPCWIWLGGLQGQGLYGAFWWTRATGIRKQGQAHVASYEHFIEPIPEGLFPDHLCRVHQCVNYAHLEPVTQQVNLKRGTTGSKTFCKHNHEFTEDNTYTNPRGQRECKQCRREANLRAYYKRKERS